MRYYGTLSGGGGGGGSWGEATPELAILTPLQDYTGSGELREQTQPPGRLGWDRQAQCQDPSQAVWSSGQGF